MFHVDLPTLLAFVDGAAALIWAVTKLGLSALALYAVVILFRIARS